VKTRYGKMSNELSGRPSVFSAEQGNAGTEQLRPPYTLRL